MKSKDLRLSLSGIMEESIVDGPGIRFVIFVQGCPHHCPGCQNQETQPFVGGYVKTVEEIFSMYSENPLLSGVTFSGGEPFCQPGPLAVLARMIKETGGGGITYTGYTYENLRKQIHPFRPEGYAPSREEIEALLDVTDLLIDGPFLLEEKSLELPYRGSSNQRLIRLGKGLKEPLIEEPITIDDN